MSCTQFSDNRDIWTGPRKDIHRNPVTNATYPFLQKCNIWSIDFRENGTDCPSRMRPLCYLYDAAKHKTQCPFGKRDGLESLTHEYCECLGLKNGTVAKDTEFNCICTRFKSQEPPVHDGKNCTQNYLFTKQCKIIGYLKNDTNKYEANCSFVNCFEDPQMHLYNITNFNTTCVNNTSEAQIAPTTIAPSTTTGLPTTVRLTSPTTKQTSKIPERTSVSDSVAFTSHSVEPTSHSVEPTSHLVVSTNNFKASTRNLIPSVSTSMYIAGTHAQSGQRGLQAASRSGHVEYSKQINEGLLLGMVILALIFQILHMRDTRYATKKQK